MIVASLVGALWSLIPALLKARYGVNGIITHADDELSRCEPRERY